MPQVINVKQHGDRHGPDCAYIGRFYRRKGFFLPGSKWANLFKIQVYGRDEAIFMFEEWFFGRLPNPPRWRHGPVKLMAALPQLRGRNLLCHCAPERCHGDVLLRLANLMDAP